MNTDSNQNLYLYTESNPNPNSLKFVANRLLVGDGESYDFPDPESAVNAPLAKLLFGYSFVKRVFYMSNFVTVTKSDDVEWHEIAPAIKEEIQRHLEAGKPLLDGESYRPANTETVPGNLSEMDVKIRALLDEYVRPAVEQDGGAIEFQSFEEGVVKVHLQGSCSGCPSSMITLKAGIENLLKSMIPEVKSVEAVGV